MFIDVQSPRRRHGKCSPGVRCARMRVTLPEMREQTANADASFGYLPLNADVTVVGSGGGGHSAGKFIFLESVRGLQAPERTTSTAAPCATDCMHLSVGSALCQRHDRVKCHLSITRHSLYFIRGGGHFSTQRSGSPQGTTVSDRSPLVRCLGASATTGHRLSLAGSRLID